MAGGNNGSLCGERKQENKQTNEMERYIVFNHECISCCPKLTNAKEAKA